MIKIEKVKNEFTGEEIDFVSPDSLLIAVIGMRNPKNSWNKTDSKIKDGKAVLGSNDLKLATILSLGGPVHGKFLRQIQVSANITAPLYWWKEFDTYKVGTVANSTSTMHKLTSREILMSDLSFDKCIPGARKFLELNVNVCNGLREKFLETIETDPDEAKRYWYSLIQTLPSSYNQTRTVTMNYEVLSGIYKYRKTHKLDEWHEFCDWIETLPYAKNLILRNGGQRFGGGDGTPLVLEKVLVPQNKDETKEKLKEVKKIKIIQEISNSQRLNEEERAKTKKQKEAERTL